MKIKRPIFHFVSYFPEWHRLGFYKYKFPDSTYALIYRWVLYLGWFEIRKWERREIVMKMLEERDKKYKEEEDE